MNDLFFVSLILLLFTRSRLQSALTRDFLFALIFLCSLQKNQFQLSYSYGTCEIHFLLFVFATRKFKLRQNVKITPHIDFALSSSTLIVDSFILPIWTMILVHPVWLIYHHIFCKSFLICFTIAWKTIPENEKAIIFSIMCAFPILCSFDNNYFWYRYNQFFISIVQFILHMWNRDFRLCVARHPFFACCNETWV